MRAAPLTARILAPLAAAVAILALPSCGGGDSVSPQQFQTDANRVCRDVEHQLDRAQRTSPVTADQAEKQAAAIVDVSQQALGSLRKIEPPEELEATYERYLGAREEAIELIERARDAAADNDADAYGRAKRRLAAEQPSRRQLALQLNLDACSRPSVPR